MASESHHNHGAAVRALETALESETGVVGLQPAPIVTDSDATALNSPAASEHGKDSTLHTQSDENGQPLQEKSVSDAEKLHDVELGGTDQKAASNGQDMSKILTGREYRFLFISHDTLLILVAGKLAIVFAGMLLSVFLSKWRDEKRERYCKYRPNMLYNVSVALDQTILAPALPVIASRFNALEQIAWIASAYFLTQCAFLLLYGQALTVFDRKVSVRACYACPQSKNWYLSQWTFMSAITLFEIGSLFCAVAPTVEFLIFGRGMFSFIKYP